MRILLIQAYLGRREPPVAPLGLAILAAHLKTDNVRIFDPNLSSNPLQDTFAEIESFHPDLVGFSLRNIDTTKYSDPFYYFEYFQRFIKSIKEALPDIPLVVGGSGFSLFPRQILERLPELDYGFYLEAENSFAQFIENGGFHDEIRGIYYHCQGNIEFTGEAAITDIGESPFPAWHLVDLSSYPPYYRDASVGIEAKRGCAMNCSYCTYPMISGTKLRMKEPEKVVDEMEMLKQQYGVDRVFFSDPVFNYPLEHAQAICQKLLDRNLQIEWKAYHQHKYLTGEYVRIARESGCQDFYFSPDAATETGLRALNKTTTLPALHRSLDVITADKKARASYNFFAAVPYTGWGNFIAAVKFLIKAKFRLGRRLTRWKLSYIRLEPGTPILADVSGIRDFKGDDLLLPADSKSLRDLFFRNTKSRVLNMLLSLHFNFGRIFGRRNVLK